MRKFIVMVGLSGSGKSHKAAELAKEIAETYPKYDEFGRANTVEIISSDSIREELLGDATDQTQNHKVFNEVHARVRKALLYGFHVIVDATCINVKDRKGYFECFKCLTEAKQKKYKKIAYVMTTPIDICKTRNYNRDRVVPEFVIDRQVGKFEIPFVEEGFDEVILDQWEYFFSENNPSKPTVNKGLNIIMDLMRGFDQKTKHHKYTLDKHCLRAKEEVEKRTNDEVLIRAALIHDIGKLYTAKLKDDGSGDYCYYSHHNIGAYSLLQNIDLVAFEDKQRTLDLLFYVNFHMLPFFIETEKAKKKWENIMGKKKYDNIVLFNECDKIASGRGD